MINLFWLQAVQKDAPPNAFFSLLNAVGILSSGVLGALYALARKEKAENNATIESVSFYWKHMSKSSEGRRKYLIFLYLILSLRTSVSIVKYVFEFEPVFTV